MNRCRHCGVELTLSTKFERPAGWVHAPIVRGWRAWLPSARWYRWCRITVAELDLS